MNMFMILRRKKRMFEIILIMILIDKKKSNMTLFYLSKQNIVIYNPSW